MTLEEIKEQLEKLTKAVEELASKKEMSEDDIIRSKANERIEEILSDDPLKSCINWERVKQIFEWISKTQPGLRTYIDGGEEIKDDWICNDIEDLKKDAKEVMEIAVNNSIYRKNNCESKPFSYDDNYGSWSVYDSESYLGKFFASVRLYYLNGKFDSIYIDLRVVLEEDLTY